MLDSALKVFFFLKEFFVCNESEILSLEDVEKNCDHPWGLLANSGYK
jgi:hypothetical protein